MYGDEAIASGIAAFAWVGRAFSCIGEALSYAGEAPARGGEGLFLIDGIGHFQSPVEQLGR